MATKDQATEFTEFLTCLRNSVTEHTFVKLVLGKYRGKEPDLRNIVIRALRIKGQECLTFVYRHRTKDITKNFPVAAGLDAVRALLGGDFKSGHLFTATENIQIEFSKKGKSMVSRNAVTAAVAPTSEHDREKQRLIDPSRPFLQELGVTNAQHQVLPSMSRKWKQINVFLDILHHALLAYPQWQVWTDIMGIANRKFGYDHDQKLHVNVVHAEHPITNGLQSWDMIDETYSMADAGEGSKILLTTDHPKSMKTLGWARQYKKSRVFCCESGHDNQTWADPNFREVLRRGILWCARKT